MSNPNRSNAYRQAAVTTASPEQILLMLYEAAIRHARKAIDCLEAKDLAGKGIYIGKTHDIINELTNTLNFEIGGEIAKNLERLYTYMTDALVKANLENSKEPLQEVLKMLDTLLSAWKEAVHQVRKG